MDKCLNIVRFCIYPKEDKAAFLHKASKIKRNGR